MKIFFSLHASAELLSIEKNKKVIVHPFTGYAHAEAQLFKHLGRAGIEVTRDLSKAKHCDAELYVGQPDKYPRCLQDMGFRPKIVLTMFEATKLPVGWPESLNSFDYVINPSKWGVETFVECGVDREKIVALPLGFDSKRFYYKKRTDRNKKWVYLWRGMSPFDRKGFKLVRQAFLDANLPDSILVAKCSPTRSPDTSSVIAEKPTLEGQRWNKILMVTKFMSWDDMVDLIHQSDVSVNPSSGEGWGLIPLEDGACGCCTMLTDYAGLAEYSRCGPMFPIRYEEKLSDYFIHHLGKDAKPDLEHIKELMIWTYENRKEARYRGYATSKAVMNYDWSVVAFRYVDFLRRAI